MSLKAVRTALMLSTSGMMGGSVDAVTTFFSFSVTLATFLLVVLLGVSDDVFAAALAMALAAALVAA